MSQQQQENSIQFGLSNIHFAKMYDNGTYAPIFTSDLPINLTLEQQSNLQDFYAGNRKVASIETDQGFSGSLEAMLFPYKFFTDILNQVVDDDGALLKGGGERSSYYALGYQIEGDVYGARVWACKCKSTPPKGGHQTTDEGVNADHETIDISATARTFTEGSGADAKVWKYAVSVMYDTEETHEAYEHFFDKVPHGVMADGPADTALSLLTIGALRLSPAFSPSVKSYTAETTAASASVVAITRDEDATVEITNGSTDVDNGGTASFSEGENTITITVTNGTDEDVYTVVVTMS